MVIHKKHLFEASIARPNDSILKLAKQFKKEESRYIVISDKSGPVGVVSILDLVYDGFAKGRDISKIKAKDIMNSPIFTVSRHEKPHSIFTKMASTRVTSCPVVNKENKCIGMINFNTVAKLV